jgi:hypothetical protein
METGNKLEMPTTDKVEKVTDEKSIHDHMLALREKYGRDFQSYEMPDHSFLVCPL